MLNRMLGDGKLIYAKYSMGLWEKGAANVEQWQMQMIDDVIEKLDIQDGDRILALAEVGVAFPITFLPNYPMSSLLALTSATTNASICV